MGEDGREFVRVGAILEFEYSCDSPPTKARVEDISEGGAFIDTSNPLPKGEEIEFRLILPELDEPIAGKAVVVWQQPTVGMGIRFIGLSDEDREQIKFYVAAKFFKSF